MKSLLFVLLFFSSPVLAEKYTIYTTERPPFSWSDIIDSEGYYYCFTNNRDALDKLKFSEHRLWSHIFFKNKNFELSNK